MIFFSHPFALVNYEQYADISPLAYELIRQGKLSTAVISKYAASGNPFLYRHRVEGRLIGVAGPFHELKVKRSQSWLLGQPGTADAVEWLDRYLDDIESVAYTVGSFDAPIAWRTDDGWTVPRVKYSYKTQDHQMRYTNGLA